MNAYSDRYFHLDDLQLDQSTFDHIIAFGKFLEQNLESDEAFPTYAIDLAKYERLFFLAAFSPSSSDSFELINMNDEDAPADATYASYPIVRDGVRIEEFRHNVLEVAGSLREGREISNLQGGEYYVIFQQMPNALIPNTFSINRATNDLLSLCDGTRSLSDLQNFD
jgi:hypothetical protein